MATDLTQQEHQQIEAFINNLRVNELQNFLLHFRVNKNGKKQDLVNRVSSLVKSPDPNVAASALCQIREMTRRAQQRPAPYPLPNNGYGQHRMPQQHQHGHGGYNMMGGGLHMGGHGMGGMGGGGSTMHSAVQGLMVRYVRNLRPLPLPFYDWNVTILEPVELPPTQQGLKMTCRQVFHFSIPREKHHLINYQVDRPKPVPRHELQLRFFNVTGDYTQMEQPDDFPINCIVKIDDSGVQLPAVIPTNKPNSEPKRPSRPVNITPYCNPPRDNHKPHKLVVEWMGDKRAYAAAIYLVYRVSADTLRERAIVNTQQHQSYEATKQLVIRRLGTGDDDGITMDTLKTSLICPLGKIRMTYPVRCRDCTHLQCFDLDLYLKMNEKKPTWKCAVCSGNAPYNRLIIDQYFQKMLKDVTPETTEVELLRDGGYKTIAEDNVCDLSDDEDVKPNLSAGGAAGPSTSKKNEKHEEIIVLSDSDDEDADLQRAIVASAKSSASKTQKDNSDDSIICLDDTPPRPIVKQQPPSTNTPPSPSHIPLPIPPPPSQGPLTPLSPQGPRTPSSMNSMMHPPPLSMSSHDSSYMNQQQQMHRHHQQQQQHQHQHHQQQQHMMMMQQQFDNYARNPMMNAASSQSMMHNQSMPYYSNSQWNTNPTGHGNHGNPIPSAFGGAPTQVLMGEVAGSPQQSPLLGRHAYPPAQMQMGYSNMNVPPAMQPQQQQQHQSPPQQPPTMVSQQPTLVDVLAHLQAQPNSNSSSGQSFNGFR